MITVSPPVDTSEHPLPWVVESIPLNDSGTDFELTGAPLEQGSVRSWLHRFTDAEDGSNIAVYLEWNDDEQGGMTDVVIPVGIARIIAAHLVEQTNRVSFGELATSIRRLGLPGEDTLRAAIAEVKS